MHNDAQYVSHDIYDVEASPSPGGNWSLMNYPPSTSISDFLGQSCPAELLPQQKQYNVSRPVHTEIEYAVAVSPKKDLSGSVESDYTYSEGTVEVRVHVIDPAYDGIIWDIELLFWTEELGTDWAYEEDFSSPLIFCQDYYYPVPYPQQPGIVVVHLSDIDGNNIGFTFSEPF